MHLSRREFLASASAATAAALLPAVASGRTRSFVPKAERVIFINLIGGPSQLDTWDPKLDAPSDVRGPFRPIATKVPGIQFTELFPHMAGIADKLSVVRSVHHDAPPVHEAGLQIVNTGHFYRDGDPMPNIGAVIAKEKYTEYNPYDWVVIQHERVNCGIDIDAGFNSGKLDGPMHYFWDSLDYETDLPLPKPTFKDFCKESFQHLFMGSKCVTIPMYDSVFDQPTWDCHAAGGALSCDLNDYRDIVAPSFDLAFTRLIQNLERAGLLDSTLVVATGEFGRTPKLNGHGGRDHWASCWSAIFAGGGVQGGRVIGSSDSWGAEPKDRPVHARDIPATVLAAMGIDEILPGNAIVELF